MIVFTDIDGTLYDYEGRMPESTREALRKLKENGHLVYFVTGRSKAENIRLVIFMYLLLLSVRSVSIP